jgi:hypothetical protein
MQTDPVEEIRERRRRLIRDRYHGSIEALIDESVTWAASHGRRTVGSRRPKPVKQAV